MLVPIDEWLDSHGIDRQRVAPITVTTTSARFHLNAGDGYERGDFTGVTLEHADWPGWQFEIDVTASGGVLALRVGTTAEGRRNRVRVTARQLRAVPMADLALAARAAIVLHTEGGVFEPDTADTLSGSEGGRRVLTDRKLAEAMKVYVDACADKHSSEEAARRLNISKATMNDWRNRARRRGLFMSLGKGRPGGELTAKGWKALEEAEG